jgi:hypothetical protein
MGGERLLKFTNLRFKVGQKVKIIRYKVHFYGIIIEIDPIFSSNMKRTIGYWFVIQYCETVDYYCEKGDKGLFLKRDIEGG